MDATGAMNPSKGLKFKLVYMRERTPHSPAELVIGNEAGECMIVILSRRQLKNLALDSSRKALNGSIKKDIQIKSL